ncbi:MAG: superoxide dismutase [Bdellovibrionales bacterium]|nr:superoxide dismutase [Bdellovibrionales bacterium]
MSITLPELPYNKKALEPHISEETLDYHYGKHHIAYVNKLNPLIENGPFAKASLEEMIKESKGAIFNNAAQVWNHTFYWNSLSPQGGGDPSKEVSDVLTNFFGSVEKFKEEFTACALGQFGSGWAWLVKTSEDKLEILSTGNADNPLQKGKTPLLTCDVWEHAYYIDYRNARPAYLKSFWDIVNWDFINKNIQSYTDHI